LTGQENLALSEHKKPGFFYGYVIVIACFVMMVVLAEFGWNRAVTSGAYSLQGVLMGVFAIPIARLSHKYGPQLVIGICGFLGGLGYILMSQVTAIWQIYLLYGMLMALSMGSYISILPVVAGWFVRRRGLMTGVVFSGMGIGMVVIPPLVSQLISAYDWRLSYAIVGIVAMIGVVAGAQFLRRDPYQVGLLPYGQDRMASAGPASGASPGLTFREALRTSQFWLLSALYFIYLVCHTVVAVHIVIHATGMGVSAINAARLLSVFGALLIVGFIIIGMTADRIGNKSGFIISFIVMLLSFILVILAGEIWTLYLFVGILGFACGGMQVLFSPIVAELFGLSSHGVILATAGFFGGIGAAIGAPMAGYVFDVTGSYSMSFVICAMLSLVAIILALLLKTPLRIREGEANGP